MVSSEEGRRGERMIGREGGGREEGEGEVHNE